MNFKMSSKDIRSFFIRTDGGSSYSKGSDSIFKGSKKRTLRVIESDDDDDDDNLIFEKSAPKKSKEAKSNKKNSPQKKREKEKEKPKDIPVSASSFFGNSPVQQKHQKVKTGEKQINKTSIPAKDKIQKSKKKEREKPNSQPSKLASTDFDDCFDEEPAKINVDELEKVSKKEKRTTPVKNSPAQKKKSFESSKNVKKTPVKEGRSEAHARTPGSAGSKNGKSSLLDSDKKRRNAESYQRYLNRPGPKHLGSKEIPKGTRTCLFGLTFVISGVLDSMEREEAVELIQRCGGRTTSSVSKKTNYIVLGEEAGKAKLEKANKFGTKKLTEDELLDLIRSKSMLKDESRCSLDNVIEGAPKKDESNYFKSENKMKRTLNSGRSPDIKGPKVRKVVEVKASKFYENSKSSVEVKVPSGYKPKLTESKQILLLDSSQNVESGTGPLGAVLWVDKYKPHTTKQIIGQAGDKSNVKKLIKWLETWAENNLNSNSKKPRLAPWQSHDGSAFKAALLSGPPGVGKTTTVHLVCKELGFDIIEFNASDTRSKKLLQEQVKELLRTKSIRLLLKGSEKVRVKHILVMDEVDGMAGNEDRGGIQELIQIIKHTKVPIVCMCNDRSHPKMRSLVNYCYDLRFSKPRVEQIKGAMMSVCFKEQINISSEALEEIIINANQDVRQVLHNLSLWSVCNKMIGTEEAKKEAVKAKKPLVLGPWDVARKVFSASDHSTMSFKEKEELFFQDYNLGPLFVHDCYIRVKPYKAKGSPTLPAARKDTENLRASHRSSDRRRVRRRGMQMTKIFQSQTGINNIRDNALEKWQAMWEGSTRGRVTFGFLASVEHQYSPACAECPRRTLPTFWRLLQNKSRVPSVVANIRDRNDNVATLNLVSKAADAIMYGDIVERAIRSENAWGLLPVQAIFSSVLPGHYMEGHVQGQIQFPVWFGKNSKAKRYDRILQELQTHMRLSISGSKEAVNLDYLHILRNSLTRPLLENGTNGISETLQLMSDYNLTKDDVDSVMELSLWPGEKDIYASIDSKVKSALTRAYYKEGKTVPFAVNTSVKKSKITGDEYEINDEAREENTDDEVADDVESDAMIKKGKPKVKEENKEKNKKERASKGTKKERKKK